MLVLFDFHARVPAVLLVIPALQVRETHADMQAATFAAADHLLRTGLVEQASRLMRPFETALREAA